MKTQSLSVLAAVALLVMFSFATYAQTLKFPAPSPKQTLEQDFGLSSIKIEYSRPGVKDRVIFGGLVPYGKMWRTGANASTRITFGEDVKVEGNPVPAGSYSLFTIPDKDSWDIMFYKDINLGANMNDYKTENEVLRIKAKPASIPNKVETFTISIGDIKPSSATIELVWEQTRVAFGITADDDAKIMKNIDNSLAADSRPYFQAASYYYDNNKDLNKALEWVNNAIVQNPKGYFITYLKARIQLKMKDNAGAIKTAEESIAQAKDAKNDDYVTLNEKLIEDAKKGK